MKVLRIPAKTLRNATQNDYEKWVMGRLAYQERHAGWRIFKGLYIGIYLFLLAMLLIYYNDIGLTPTVFAGLAFAILAIMVILFGFVEVLHYRMLINGRR